MQFACTLTYTIQPGCRQTHDEPAEPETIDDLRVHCITRIQLGTGKRRYFLKPRDAEESAAYLRMLDEWVEDHRAEVENDIWEFEQERAEQQEAY